MADIFGAPATKARAVTPSDTKDATTRIDARALYVGTTGDLTVVMKDDPTDTGVLFKTVPVGTIELSVKYVLSTGTTATNLVALY